MWSRDILVAASAKVFLVHYLAIIALQLPSFDYFILF